MNKNAIINNHGDRYGPCVTLAYRKRLIFCHMFRLESFFCDTEFELYQWFWAGPCLFTSILTHILNITPVMTERDMKLRITMKETKVLENITLLTDAQKSWLQSRAWHNFQQILIWLLHPLEKDNSAILFCSVSESPQLKVLFPSFILCILSAYKSQALSKRLK